jgi:hypothetical protein
MTSARIWLACVLAPATAALDRSREQIARDIACTAHGARPSRAPAQTHTASNRSDSRGGRSLTPFGISGLESLGVFLDAFIRESNYYSRHVI